MKPLSVAMIGCGMFARQSHLPNLVSLPEAHLHTCCDLSEENLLAAESFHPQKISRDFRAVIEDPEVEALIVATTETFRVPIVEAAARAGKPVYTEKPLADTLENAKTIQKLVNQSGIPFCVGHNRRSSPAMAEARDIFVRHMQNPEPCPWRFRREPEGTLPVGDNPGAPVVSMRVNDDWMSWKAVHLQNELNRKVGLLLSEGTHFVDLANWFVNARPTTVFCSGEGVLNHTMIIHYSNGGMATLAMAATGTFGYPKELLEAFGHGGAVVVDHMLEIRTAGVAGAPAVKRFPLLNDRHPNVGAAGGLHGWLEKKQAACRESVASGNPMDQFTAEPDKGHRQMLRNFIAEIRGERGPVCPVDDALTATVVCLAAAKSYLEKRIVPVSEIADISV